MFQVIHASWAGAAQLEKLYLTGGMSESAMKVKFSSEIMPL
jgi:hypothetical protein